MIYLGLDPSFSKTGVCYLNNISKTIIFNAVSPPGTNESYKDALNRAGYIALETLKGLGMTEDVTAIVEEPLMSSFKASRLGILSGVVVWSLAFMPNIKKLYSVTPTYIARTNANIAKSQKLTKKQASLWVALEILDYMVSKGWQVTILNNKYNKDGSMKARKLSHDEAEALILTLLLMTETKAIEAGLIAEMVKINKKFLNGQTITLLKGE